MGKNTITPEKSKSVLKGYKNLQERIGEIISESGLKIGFIVEKSGLSPSTFYRKKKNLTFTVNEMTKIVEICQKTA